MTAILQLIYCFLIDMIASFKDIWLLGWDSILGPSRCAASRLWGPVVSLCR